jgi:hypothetical protein
MRNSCAEGTSLTDGKLTNALNILNPDKRSTTKMLNTGNKKHKEGANLRFCTPAFEWLLSNSSCSTYSHMAQTLSPTSAKQQERKPEAVI